MISPQSGQSFPAIDISLDGPYGTNSSMHGHTFRPFNGGMLTAAPDDARQDDGSCFADEVIVDFPSVAPAPVALPVASADLLADPQSAGDTALTLVAELSSDMDFETAREAGLAARGSAEHAVTHLAGSELRELQRLLQEELARSGA